MDDAIQAERPGISHPKWQLGRFIFLRSLGFVLVLGFLGLWSQAPGLIGSHGLTPVGETLADIKARAAEGGTASAWRMFLQTPSLFWLSSTDAAIRFLAALGFVAALALTLGFVQPLAAAVCFFCSLSFSAVDFASPGFLWFDWPFDELLLEVTFVSIFFSPRVSWARLRTSPPVSAALRLLLVWVLFREMFGSGIAKVLLRQPSWLDLTAIRDFLETMPNPAPGAAWVHATPNIFLKGLALGTLVYELVGPFFYFGPARARRAVAYIGILFMVGIQFAGNFRGFNIVTSGLLLLLVEDDVLRRWIPIPWLRRLTRVEEQRPTGSPAGRWLNGALAGFLFILSLGPLGKQLRLDPAEHSRSFAQLQEAFAPFHLVGRYYMFSIVPTERWGLVIQGSQDGKEWVDYEVPGVPSRVDRKPRWFAPYPDYLGFCLWIVGFGGPEKTSRWMQRLEEGLLRGYPEVENLFSAVPFDNPPKLVRVVVYRFRYNFGAETPNEGVALESWWWREPLAPYRAVRSLTDLP